MNKETAVFGRMRQLREWLKEQNPKITEAAIERKMGVATNYFKTRLKAPISEGEKGVRPQTVENLKQAWASQKPETPSLNMEWMLTGKGEMFTDEIRYNSTDEIRINQSKGIPYFDVDFLGGFDIMENNQTNIPAYFIDMKPYNKSGNVWCNINGDSMSPRINNGDKICLQPLNFVDDIIFGDIYAIVTKGNMRTVKWVIRSPEPDKIRLVPENKDPRYGDYQDIPKHEIRYVFKVVGAVHSF